MYRLESFFSWISFTTAAQSCNSYVVLLLLKCDCRTPLAYAYTAGSMASSNPCDQVLTPPSVDDQPSSSIKRPASAGQPTTSAPTLNSASCRSSAKKDYTQLGNITIDDEKEMFSSDGDDSDNDEEAEVMQCVKFCINPLLTN